MGEEQVYKVSCFDEKDAPVEEEEAAGDMDDPLAMLGGMGEEQVYKVSCFDEKDAPVEEEEAAGDMDDPLAMLGGMGECVRDGESFEDGDGMGDTITRVDNETGGST